MYFTTHTLVVNTQVPFKLHILVYIPNIILHSFLLTITYTIPISPTDKEIYLPSDAPNFTNLMVSHYDCEKQHTFRRFNSLKVKQCTEAPSNIQHANVTGRVCFRAKAKRIEAYKCVAYAQKRKKIYFQVPLNIDVLIELSGIITLWHFLLHWILLNVKRLSDISMVQITKC